MILGTTGRLAILASLTLLSAPARADVMEIGENGARWIAGQQAGMPAGDLSMTPAQLATALQRNFRVTLDPPRLAAIVGIPCGNL